jgi:hypothetical protein
MEIDTLDGIDAAVRDLERLDFEHAHGNAPPRYA